MPSATLVKRGTMLIRMKIFDFFFSFGMVYFTKQKKKSKIVASSLHSLIPKRERGSGIAFN